MGLKYFLDTYALYEIASGSESYKKYWGSETATSIFNITEIYYAFLREFGEQFADERTLPLFLNTLPVQALTIKEAMKFRLKHKKSNLSYADCIGYQLAKENNFRFLTGDKEFKGLSNVEFVK
jgi:predicted nucleic acid-binding protein